MAGVLTVQVLVSSQEQLSPDDEEPALKITVAGPARTQARRRDSTEEKRPRQAPKPAHHGTRVGVSRRLRHSCVCAAHASTALPMY
jgi:hypothetical protein